MSLSGRTIAPMKAAAGELPVGDAWSYELKWDGMRLVLFIEDGEVRAQTTNLLDATVSFPELQPLAGSLSHFTSVVLDGEMVAFDEDGQPSFNRMQQRMHVSDPSDAARRAGVVPAMFIAFDLLHLNGEDLFELPFNDRRRLLDQILDEGPAWRISALWEDDPQSLLAVVTERHLEGLVAKRNDSVYRPGKRSSQWRKIKPRRRQEFVVGGWLTGEGNRANRMGSLLVGYHDQQGLRFAGRVGSGFNDADLDVWGGLLAERAVADSPFWNPVPPKPGRTLRWVRPELMVEVAFSDWGGEDAHLRHPSYLGRRFDKDPADVIRET